METKNLTIRGMIDRLLIYTFEVAKSVSAGVGSYRTPDIERLKTYLQELKTYKAQAMSVDPLDVPHWHARAMSVPAFPEINWTENPSVNDIKMMLEMLYVELLECQSKDLPLGFFPADSRRIDALLNNAESFLINYVEQATPIDTPEAASAEVQ